ncbi:MAG: fibrobacter succinogenes major paralogous domain-containing protein [Bacteroidales bacterium]|nr:fibrobacter succinogenes major paralogous domain-containing protein [Bacteroidales bacterium]
MTLSQRDSIPNPGQALIVYCTDCGTYGQLQLYNGTKWTDLLGGPAETNVPTVFNPSTGRYWMALNLGASHIADSSRDTAAYGDLYQWGRLDDGHQLRTSPTTLVLSGSDIPGHDKFIMVTNQPYDWRDPQNVNLWQGVSGTNNPCPSGYRIPTRAEWDAERFSWSTNDADGAFNSALKLTLAGNRSVINGDIGSVGAFGNYWVSEITGSYSYYLEIGTSTGVYGTYRGYGSSVRCIKD